MASDWLRIETYWLRYEVNGGKCMVGIRYRDNRGPEEKMKRRAFPVGTGHALFLADLLRNEKPVYWNPDQQVIATNEQEPVGEGES